MAEICPKCGLPKDLCACKEIEREIAPAIKIYVRKERFGKLLTIIEGVEKNEIEAITKELKRKLACGGTCKNGFIALQGDHRTKAKELLARFGYPIDAIEVF